MNFSSSVKSLLLAIYFSTTFFFFFLPHCMACRILVPWSGIEPGPSAVKVWSPNHWTTREFPMTTFNGCIIIHHMVKIKF